MEQPIPSARLGGGLDHIVGTPSLRPRPRHHAKQRVPKPPESHGPSISSRAGIFPPSHASTTGGHQGSMAPPIAARGCSQRPSPESFQPTICLAVHAIPGQTAPIVPTTAWESALGHAFPPPGYENGLDQLSRGMQYIVQLAGGLH